MVMFLLFCGIQQKKVAQVRNIRDKFENSNGDFLLGAGKRGRKS